MKKNKRSHKYLILVLLLGILATSSLVGCDLLKKEPADLIDKLYDNKTDYIGDNSKIGNIVSHLEFPKGYNYKSIEILSEEEPYGLKILFEVDKRSENIEYEIKAPSAILFSLVENLDQIMYSFKEENVEEIIVEKREDVDDMTLSVMGMKTKELGKNKSKFKELVDYYEDLNSSSPKDIGKTDLEPTRYETVNDFKDLTMNVEEKSIKKTGLNLEFENKSNNDTIYGDYFTIEEKIDGQWYETSTILKGEYGFNDIGYELLAGEENELEVDWEWLYGSLETGEYRIIKSISDLKASGSYKEYDLGAEFIID